MSKSNFRLFTGNAHPALAQEIAGLMKMELSDLTIKKFACGEVYINIDETVRGKEVFLIHTTRGGNINEDYMELFLMCDAMRRSFASKVHVVLPHYGYARQDKLHEARETISAKLIADLLVKSGAEHVITMHLHSDQNQAFFDVPVDNLNPRNMFADYIKQKGITDGVIVSPDAGGAKSAKKIADKLGFSIAILHKTRPEHNISEITHIVGDIKGKTPIIYDDMVDTAGSVCNAKEVLIKGGSNPDVYMMATHPILSNPAAERFRKAQFKEVIFTNSLPIPEEKMFPGLKILSVAPLLAGVMEGVIQQKSITPLYFK